MKIPLRLILKISALALTPAAMADARNDALFEELRWNLDFNSAASAAKIPGFEDKLLKAAVDDSPPVSRDKNEAMRWVYASLYLRNTNRAAQEGALSYEQLVSRRKFSGAPGLASELLARQQKAIELIERARDTLGEDQRVSGWLMGARLAAEELAGGAPQDRTLQGLVQAAVDYPQFNLFTAILATREIDLPPQLDGQILRLTRQMVGPDNPCRQRSGDHPADRVCGNTPKAPFNLPTAVTLLGDVLVKHAEKALMGGNPADAKEGYELGYTALGVYRSVLEGPDAGTALRWGNLDLLKERIQKADLLVTQRVGFGDYWKSKNAARPYQCASCHGG